MKRPPILSKEGNFYKDKVREIFEGTYAGYITKVSKIESEKFSTKTNSWDYNWIRVYGKIYDQEANIVGQFCRRIEINLGRITVHHHYLYLKVVARGKGFAKEFITECEKRYRDNGVSEILLQTANRGGYYWPKLGFTFSQKSSDSILRYFDMRDHWKMSCLSKIEKAIKAGHIPQELLDEWDDKVLPDQATKENILDYDLSKYISEPLELHTMGTDYPWKERGELMWIGKKIMLSSNLSYHKVLS